jgi:hypothetical protein
LRCGPPGSKDKIKDFGGDTPYSVMFGPDICGFGTRKVHVILPYKGKNHLIKKDITAKTDTLTHVYTLRIMPNNTYQVGGESRSAAGGSCGAHGVKSGVKCREQDVAARTADWGKCKLDVITAGCERIRSPTLVAGLNEPDFRPIASRNADGKNVRVQVLGLAKRVLVVC